MNKEERNIFLNKLKNCVDNSPQPQYRTSANSMFFNTTRKSHTSKRLVSRACGTDEVIPKFKSCYSNAGYESEMGGYAESSAPSTIDLASYKTEDFLSDSMPYICDSVRSQSVIESGDDERSYRSYRSLNGISPDNLRETAKSKCRISAVIDDTIKQLCSSKKSDMHYHDVSINNDNEVKHKTYSSLPRLQLTPTSCEKVKLKPLPKEQVKERITGKSIKTVKQKDKAATIRKPIEVLEPKEYDESDMGSVCCHCGTVVSTVASREIDPKVQSQGSANKASPCKADYLLTISVDDVVNTQVINPMIRKMQRMYLNSLKEEMSILEDLELLPQRINEVYKTTILNEQND